jgi:signal transduction histidine kinase
MYLQQRFRSMKNLLPDTIATRAMALLVVGLAVTHLVSNLFYATDRESALLTAGGEHAIQWVASTGATADKSTPQEWADVIRVARSDNKFVTITKTPVVDQSTANDWREIALQRELSRHVPTNRLGDYRTAYAPAEANTPALTYWRSYLAENGQQVPDEMILVSLRLDTGSWLNMATPIQSPPRFFSARLGWSMAVMLIAVTVISALIVGRMTDPLRQLSRAAEKLGTDVQGPAIPETGPEEVRRTAHAFNVMQDRIRRFVEDRTQMLGAIAHDLGTPITRLRLRAEFVEDRDIRNKMLRDLDDMQHMVASTLSFIHEDATSEPQARVDLGSLLARVCDDIKDAGANVELAEIPRWVLLDCRPIALRRALGNLIENAIKYGSSARVSLELEPEKLLILIDDEGPGIPEDRQEDVFQPFHRLEDSRNRETGGTGLGLAVARTIVRAHGGDIRLTNRATGGLRVELRLPRPFQPEEDKSRAVGNPNAKPNDDKIASAPMPAKIAGYALNTWKNQKPDPNPVVMGRDLLNQSGMETRLPKERTPEWKTL